MFAMSEPHRTPPPITDRLLDELERERVGARISILRRLVGLPVRGITGERIDRALAARGLRAGAFQTTSPNRAA